jgi:hypothetical protein
MRSAPGLRPLSRPRIRSSRGRAGALVGWDGCEVWLTVCPVFVPCPVSRVCPGSPRCPKIAPQSDLTLSTALSGNPVIAAMLSGLVRHDLVLRCHPRSWFYSILFTNVDAMCRCTGIRNHAGFKLDDPTNNASERSRRRCCDLIERRASRSAIRTYIAVSHAQTPPQQTAYNQGLHVQCYKPRPHSVEELLTKVKETKHATPRPPHPLCMAHHSQPRGQARSAAPPQ